MSEKKAKTILIAGAGGFIGGFIAERALSLGYETYAGVRKSTSRRYLKDERLHFVEIDYDDEEKMEEALAANAPGPEGWDEIIWNLGATKCADWRDFNKINYGYLLRFTKAMKKLGLKPEKFLYMSSLSALGPGDEEGYTPLSSQTVPHPNTKYGLSKIKAEMCLELQPDIPWIIFRPTGVYGPHEKDYLMMIESIDRHIDVSMGYKRQMLTFIYVDDLVDAMFKCLGAETEKVKHRKYIISEDRAYTQKEFRETVARHLGTRVVVPLALPMWAVYAVSAVSEKVAAWQGKASTLNRDKYKIMKQRNWQCDTSEAERDFGFKAQWPLDRGIAETVKAYKASKKRDQATETKPSRKKTMKNFFAILFLSTTLMSWGWGQKGHDVTAYIAEQHLTPAAKAAVDSIFEGKSMVYWSNWLDNASHTRDYAYTKTWHYKNVDEGERYEEAAANPAGDVVVAIKGRIEILSDPNSSLADKRLALRMLVHLVGDLHMPMHMGHATDLGGNRITVKYFGKDQNLHSVWDTSLVESAHKWSYSEWQQQIDRLNAEEEFAVKKGSIDDWAKQTIEIADQVYKEMTPGSNVSYNEVARWAPVIEDQLLAGGLRLATILNSIFQK